MNFWISAAVRNPSLLVSERSKARSESELRVTALFWLWSLSNYFAAEAKETALSVESISNYILIISFKF